MKGKGKGKDILGLVLAVAVLFGINSFIEKLVLEDYITAYTVRLIVNAGIAMILAMSLNLVNGCAGQFSLGHAGFMAVGAYTSAALTTILPAHLMPYSTFFQTTPGVGFSIIFGGILAGFVGYLVGLPSLKLRGDYLAIVTLGFGEIIRIVILNIQTLGGAVGLPGIPAYANFFWVYFWVFLTMVGLLRLIHSSFGRAILSVRENEIAAEAMGIDIAHYKIVAFVISSFLAGIAGGLFAHFQRFIDPNSFVFNKSVDVVIMIVMGGLGSFSGAILGAVIVTVVPELLRELPNGWAEYRMVVFPLILIVLMLVRPMGILGHREVWHLFRRKQVAK